MVNDCIRYKKGCESCQRFGDVQVAPASMLHPVVKVWPFRGWGLDFVGEIHLSSSKGHRFVLVTTDYFTKWTKVVPLRNMTHQEVISFVQEHIIHRFGIPQTLMTDQGTSFMSHQFWEFAASMKIKVLNSSLYYAQANGQAESSNKTLLKIIKKKISKYPIRWHEVLSEALWAHRTSRHDATKVTPFELVYGQEVVLPIEINLQSFRVAKQDMVSLSDYTEGMMKRIDDMPESRLRALQEIEREKLKIAKVYSQKVKEKLFQVELVVWKIILPLGSKDQKFGKWSPSWEGHFRIIGIVQGNAYFVKTLEGKKVEKAINGRYMKKYFPSTWQGT
jgi:hypothetical protein